jgi:CheY-like chemotaxis protein
MPEAREQASGPFDDARVAGMRVLVVEDDPEARELLAELLGSCGMKVRLAASVATALAALHQERPDIIVSDIGMPGEDGYALARKIRALPDDRGGNIPMVALTAFARPEDRARARAFAEGFDAHVTKAGETSRLVDVLGSLRHGRPA